MAPFPESLIQLIPAISAGSNLLYQSRERFQGVYNLLLGKESRIVITGLPGVGKTVLFDYLTGAAYEPGYTSPIDSVDLETRSIKVEKHRLIFNVIPGQDSPARRDAFNKLFNVDNKSSIDGVIHVVANGMSRVGINSQLLRVNTSLQDYRQERLDEELEDLNETCERIRNSFCKKLRPPWLLVAFTKVDLYHNSIKTAKNRYSMQGQSEFSNRIRTLSNQIGTDNFLRNSLPFCGRLDDFVLGK
jgi:GTPase SAR1 family protein